MTDLAIRYVASPTLSFLKGVYNFIEGIGRARAASHLAQHGHYEAARRIVLGRDE